MNWFGSKVGAGQKPAASTGVGGGVGKYLNLKRPLEASAPANPPPHENDKKKRKVATGFGDFSGW